MRIEGRVERKDLLGKKGKGDGRGIALRSLE
jgi:hypothetical protein